MTKEEIRQLKLDLLNLRVDPDYDYGEVITGTELDDECTDDLIILNRPFTSDNCRKIKSNVIHKEK